jgi:hypothetical protein
VQRVFKQEPWPLLRSNLVSVGIEILQPLVWPLPWFPATTTARCGGVFIALDLAAYAKSIFATILRDVFSGINSWTAHNTASINQQNVVA